MDDLAKRATEWGIEPEYIDARGERRTVEVAALRRILAAIAGNRAPPQHHLLPRTLVIRRGSAFSLPFKPPEGARVHWRVTGRTNVVLEGDDSSWRRLSELPVASLDLKLSIDPPAAASDSATLLIAPAQAYQGAAAPRVYALAVQLYAVRSQRNWGIGDFTDLAGLLRLAHTLGAAGVALNPLHALFEDDPERASPYAPNSREFLNPLYIDLDAVPEFPGLDDKLRAERARLRDSKLVDYRGVAALKRQALRATFASFVQSGEQRRRRDFQAFCRSRGRALSRFAAFETLRRRFDCAWWDWPAEWRRPDDRRTRALSETDDEVTFHKFVQWLAERQLRDCCRLARRLTLPIGLFLDVAVGVEAAGADAWSSQGAIIRDLSVGAPPDVYNPAGQDWGLAAFSPHALEAERFQSFRRTVAAVMRYAGAVRLDHVLGFARLFLIPRGFEPSDGAYVRYPLEALLAVVAQESVRNKCLVIGEDLGTVPANLRASLARWGIWSYLVMMFERENDGAFHPPERYAENALVTFTTHDLPTLAGWWSGHDLRIKQALGIDPGESQAQRDAGRLALSRALTAQGLSFKPGEEFFAVARYLAATKSRLLVVSIEDALGLMDQPNVPGTVDEHPNWRRRLPVLLEALNGNERLLALKAVLAESGRMNP